MNLVTLWHLMAMAVIITRQMYTCLKQDAGSSLRVLQAQNRMRNSSSSTLKLLELQPKNAGFVSNGSGRSVGGSVGVLRGLIKEEQDGDEQYLCDWEEGRVCMWNGDDSGFKVTTGAELAAKMSKEAIWGPMTDNGGNPDGRFIFVGGESKPDPDHIQLYSSLISPTITSSCKLMFMVHANNILDRKVSLFYESISLKMSSEIATKSYVANNSWVPITLPVGKIDKEFRLMLEVWVGDVFPYHVAYDDIRLVNCKFVDNSTAFVPCHQSKAFECQPGLCINSTAVCDIKTDCPNGLDEGEICEEVKKWNAYCNFESGSCGWHNDTDNHMMWIMQTNNEKLLDHTYKNQSGHYMYLDSRRSRFAHRGTLRSITFPPPPRNHSNPDSAQYKSCYIRFYYQLHGTSAGDLSLASVELIPGKIPGNETQLWRSSSQNKIKNWQRITVGLPPLTHRYYLEFASQKGLSGLLNVAIDDFSLSPSCFTSGYKFTTCGSFGTKGPTQEQCELSYKSSGPKVTVSDGGVMSGIQRWVVPESGVYSVTAKGSGGGQGFRNRRPSLGDVTYGVFNWTQGEVIYILIGQAGAGACDKPLTLPGNIREMCEEMLYRKRRKRDLKAIRKQLQQENKLNKTVENGGGGGGGGGGATFIFKMNESTGIYIPLLISSGGGGLGTIIMEGATSPDGRGYSRSLSGTNGIGSNNNTGAGGGWNDTNRQSAHSGWSLAAGGFGGGSCKGKDGWLTSGGFGGGGGGCSAGGGGGGYTGGDASLNDSVGENGSGGYSYNASVQVLTILPHVVESSRSSKDGSVNIFPSFIGCGCEYQCVIFDVEGVLHSCICPEDQHLDENGRTCHVGVVPGEYKSVVTQYLEIILPIILIIALAAAMAMFLLYHRYRRQLLLQSSRQECHYPRDSSELQLNRIRQNAAGRVTEYNPNYEFGGSMCTIQDLKEISRENLNLIKALGQGAFGEVYQGYLANVPGETTDIPVAIKTLPELSTDQAEMDFLMEALIMSKFRNPNIVQFIGVCFEKLPKFIVLELLPGGDLKSYLRESRRKPEKPSALAMRDLLTMAIDVAKGCQYLEENHFIHRDVAARNCLLTSRDANRVVKIADFGMARDIYRADYYRKGGKAMLPVKWMPPEAFMDGIFTSKTDVWSFGVLLWEVMSLGFMPYPGRGNQEVMQLVTSGGRLEPPPNCPGPVHSIMMHCWGAVPDDRPTFSTILERLDYCLQDPNVISVTLPVFHRPPSTERDTTIMRPSDTDVCLQVHRSDVKEPQSPSSNDYLVPIPSNYSLCTEKTELQSASSLESVDRILEMEPDNGQRVANNVEGATCRDPLVMPSPMKPNYTCANNWETSFSKDKNPLSWGGGYQSVPTQDFDNVNSGATGGAVSRVPLATIPPPECSSARKSPPSAIARQRPNYVKKPSVPASELPLDAANLQKQTSPPPSNCPTQVVSYANVAVSNSEPVRVYGGSSKDIKC